ncbi:hypothetical protein BDW22DRAFT_1428373 [Trametopsis cervina]|nr:hypothetical protein BDW22DRAFT_1428373 [Trametopsis cervina]
MSSLDIPATYETVMQHEAAVKALALVGLTALIYDHLMTLDLEIELIWRARSGFVSIVFLLNRYIVPMMLIVDTYELSGVGEDSIMFCKVWTALQSLLTFASFISIHALVSIRVYAMHTGRRWVGRFLWVSMALYIGSTVAFIVWSGIPVISNKGDLQPSHHACVGATPWNLWLVWLPTIVFESLLFILTLIALIYSDTGKSFSELSTILYRDGTIYFAAVIVCSSFCLLVWAFAPPTLNGLARYFALAMVNIVAARMVLNLKAFAASKRATCHTSDSPLAIPASPRNYYVPSTPRSPRPQRFHDLSISPVSTVDLEMYTIEREYQQLGTKILR